MPERGGRDGRRPDRRRGGGNRGGGGGAARGAFRGARRGGRGCGVGGPGNNRSNGSDTPMSMDFDDTPSHTPPPAAATDASYKAPLTEAIPQDTPRFADLAGQNLVHPLVLQTITEDLKFDHMMPVQAATLWELLPPRRSDCLVQAKTGTGKTVAFLLPALQTMLSKTLGGGNRGSDSTISLLVISPTRELAMQIAQEASSLLQRLPRYRVRIAIGGTNKDREERQIRDGCDVLIATPGRLLDHMSNEDVIYALRALDTLVLDEADRLLDMGFMPALRDIVGKLPDRNKVPRQGMLFSATIAPHVKQVAGLVLSPSYQFISTIPEGESNTHERVPQHLIKVPTFSAVSAGMVGAVRKEAALATGSFKAIVFAPTAAMAGLYGQVLAQIPGLPPVSTLHSRMTQSRRTKVTNEYREAASAILTATDVVARGMDFPGVTTVFQVGVPSEKQSYIHRLGRTARADAEGKGIFLIAEDESFFPKWTLKDITFVPQDADVSAGPEVAAIMARMDEEEKAQIYKAWLGYYNNHMKGLRWDKEELVRQANTYAREALGAPETPAIQRSTVGKMGLRGTRGLNIVPDRPKAPRGRGGGRGGN